MRLFLFAAIALRAQPVDFAREIRPLLSDRCFACHGPDESKRMAGLRLDVEAEAKTASDSRVGVAPGNPDDSEILKRIKHANDALRMPPAHLGHKRLAAALIKDLKQRGMFDDTLFVWGGEFGRTVYSQGVLTKQTYGRDHHPRCYAIWLTGGGIKRGLSFGETDDYSYNIVDKPVHVHDLNAKLPHCLGIDHTRLAYRYQGRDFRLTDVEGNVRKDILA